MPGGFSVLLEKLFLPLIASQSRIFCAGPFIHDRLKPHSGHIAGYVFLTAVVLLLFIGVLVFKHFLDRH